MISGHQEIKLTAIVPTTGMYGRLQLLRNLLAEIKDLPVEVIIVHDLVDAESAEELKEIITELANPKISYYETSNGNPGATRNFGLKHATGEWIAFWDSDDKPIPAECIAMILEAEKLNRKIAVGGYESLIAGKSVVRHALEANNTAEQNLISIGLNPGLWRWVFKKEMLKDKFFLSLRMAEDQDFLVTLNIWDYEVYFFHNLVYGYTTDATGQLTKNRDAISDLVESRVFLRNAYQEKTDIMKRFILLIWLRQSITLLKKGSTFNKFKVLQTSGFFLVCWFSQARFLVRIVKRVIEVKT
jgi:glycosyltransferase involved in cell wall biosynthesis